MAFRYEKEKLQKIWPLFVFIGILLNPISLLIILVILFFSINNKTYTFTGMDYYYKHHETVWDFELTKFWIPEEDIFWNDFQYKEADFWYEIKYTFNETCILYVKYEETEYNMAKSFISNNANLCSNHVYQYKETTFIENLDLPIDYCNFIDGENTCLEWDNYLGYNDEKCILFFIGVFISDESNSFGDEITSSEVFVFDLERYFYQFIELF